MGLAVGGPSVDPTEIGPCFKCGGPTTTFTPVGYRAHWECMYRISPLAELLTSIESVWTDYIVFPSAFEPICLALWVAHTYVFSRADATPYLWVTSAEYESGKTRLLEVAKELVREPMMASSITASALYSVIEDREPTLLLDEVDAVFGRKTDVSDAAESLRQILNAGYRRGNPAYRVVFTGKQRKVEAFSTFSPKALAGLKTLPRTLASRCVEIKLHRKMNTEKVQPFRVRQVRQRFAPIIERLERWSINVELPDEPKVMPAELGDRAADMWEPLLVIAEAAGSDWPAKARAAAVALSSGNLADESSPSVLLLEHLRDVWGNVDEVNLFSSALVERLRGIEEAPWGDWYGREFKERDLAKLLKPFGISSHQVRVGDASKKGYRRDELVDSWSRYLSPPERKQGKHGKQSPSMLTPSVSDVSNVSLPEAASVNENDGALLKEVDPRLTKSGLAALSLRLAELNVMAAFPGSVVVNDPPTKREV